jgi:endonuclease/exonuclease/phosphatase family metal-dependent hydrolase
MVALPARNAKVISPAGFALTARRGRRNTGAMRHPKVLLLLLWLSPGVAAVAAELFSIGTYNVENYLDAPAGTRRVKPPEARARVREMIRALDADVLGPQEMGTTNALLELRASLRAEGLDYPHWEHVRGHDTNIHLAVLSKFPILARRAHTNLSYLLGGRRLWVSRGFAEVDIAVSPSYRCTVLVAHLKSKRPVPEADQAEMREEEARLLRGIIEARLKSDPKLNLVVMGDLNDTKDSRAIRTILGPRGNGSLVDTRPAERNGDRRTPPRSGYAPQNITWTYFYGIKDAYERIDYLLVSGGMAREWDEGKTFVLAAPHWGEASDHRPLKATFVAEDR